MSPTLALFAASISVAIAGLGALVELHINSNLGIAAVLVGCTGFAVAAAAAGQPLMAFLGGLSALYTAYRWWRNNRNGGGDTRIAARELGAKSKARIEALVRQMTPSPIPSPTGA